MTNSPETRPSEAHLPASLRAAVDELPALSDATPAELAELAHYIRDAGPALLWLLRERHGTFTVNVADGQFKSWQGGGSFRQWRK